VQIEQKSFAISKMVSTFQREHRTFLPRVRRILSKILNMHASNSHCSSLASALALFWRIIRYFPMLLDNKFVTVMVNYDILAEDHNLIFVTKPTGNLFERKTCPRLAALF
jgi:hypothetical protein